ncbi:37S ribosomal protein S23 mitochondrial, partial [Dinochytrium kinnereticum]
MHAFGFRIVAAARVLGQRARRITACRTFVGSAVRNAQQKDATLDGEPKSKKQQRRQMAQDASTETSEGKVTTKSPDAIMAPSKANFTESPIWKPENATSDSAGTFFRVVPGLDQYEGEAFTKDPANHKIPQSSVMLRECTLKIMKDVMEELAKGRSTRKIVLDGEPGSGKSSVLLQLSGHFSALDYIVFYVPRPSHWISAKEFYSKTESGTFIQPKLTSSVLKLFLNMNRTLLSKIQVVGEHTIGKSVFKGSLKDLSELGAGSPDVAHAALKAVLSELLSDASSRPPLVIAIDQVNALFTKTAYNDTDGTVLTSDRFELVSVFHDALSRRELTNAVILTALDQTDPTIKSPYLDHLLHQGTRVTSKFEDISDVDRYGVLPPTRMGRTKEDPVVLGGRDAPVGFEVKWVPTFDRVEVEMFLRWFGGLMMFH